MTSSVKVDLQPLGRTVEVGWGTSLRDVLQAYGMEFPCAGRGRCGGCRVRVLAGRLSVSDEQRAVLTERELSQGWRLACQAAVHSDVRIEVGRWEKVVLADHSAFDFRPRPGLGIAIDLGTTTVVAQLIDLRSGRVLAVQKGMNPHVVHGSDVMSRIQIAIEGGRGAALVEEMRAGLGALLGRLLEQAGGAEKGLESVVLCGNTVMHHFFCGLDIEPLSRWPFASRELGPRRFRPRELGWALPGDPVVRFLPCLGGFVGSDILCGILATRIHESDRLVVLVDLGTNGEIVAGDGERIVCVSAAAGPAFEGGGIHMGMSAGTGAISEVTVEGGGLRCRVVGDVSARGICGSGLVDAVAAGLDLGLIEPSGRLTSPSGFLDLAPPVRLTQGDIRQLQLAKAAISAGMRVLRGRFGDESWYTAPVYLAGAFGNYVNRTSARRIGLIDVPEENVRQAGNTALLGAKLALFADEDEFPGIRGRVEHISLAADPGFKEAFIEEVAFPSAPRPRSAEQA